MCIRDRINTAFIYRYKGFSISIQAIGLQQYIWVKVFLNRHNFPEEGSVVCYIAHNFTREGTVVYYMAHKFPREGTVVCYMVYNFPREGIVVYYMAYNFPREGTVVYNSTYIFPVEAFCLQWCICFLMEWEVCVFTSYNKFYR